jgi:hypothetical protein
MRYSANVIIKKTAKQYNINIRTRNDIAYLTARLPYDGVFYRYKVPNGTAKP